MTAKDQAIELMKTFSNVTRPMFKVHTLKVYMHPEHVKQCALICLNQMKKDSLAYGDANAEDFLNEVKQEINNLQN